MSKTKENLKASEEFIQSVLMRNFNQKIDADQLRAAAEKLCEAVPGKKEKVAAIRALKEKSDE